MASTRSPRQRPRLWLNQQSLAQRKDARLALEQKQIRLSLIKTIATSSDTSIDAIIQNTVEQISHYFTDLRVAYSIIDEQGRLKVLWSAQPSGIPPMTGTEIDLTIAPDYLACLQNLQPVMVCDVTHHAQFLPHAIQTMLSGVQAVLDVPLIHDHRTVGLLCFGAPTAHSWSQHEFAALTDVAQYLSVTLGNAHEQLERSRAEEALRESEERYRITSQLISDYAYSYSVEPDGTLVHEWLTEDSFTRITGFTREESDASGSYSLYHPGDVDQVVADIQKVFRGQPVTGEYRIITKSGAMRWLRIYRRAEYDEQQRVNRLYGVAQDITERKQAEEALRDSELRYRSVVTAMAEGIVLQTSDGVIQACNASAARILGLTTERMMGRSSLDPRWRGAVHEDGSPFPGSEHPGMVALQSGEPQATIVMGIHKPDGRLTWISVNSQPLFHEGENSPYAVVSSFSDITDAKNAERRRFELELEQERVRILTEFIEDTAHEFRTPLAAINTSAYLMSRLDNREERREKLNRIQNRTADMTELLDAMLLLLRLDEHSKLFIEEVDIRRVMRTIEDGLRTLIDAKHLNLVVDIDSNLPCLKCDFGELAKAFKSILVNAVQFTPPGGTITVSGRVENQHMLVDVCDNGAGISREALPHIFEMFYREDKARKNRGFGLGLPIARRIIERYKGRIEVESQVGSGSLFRVILPLPN